jgi:hypothetical protein
MVPKIQNGGQKSKWHQKSKFLLKNRLKPIEQTFNYFWMQFVEY